MPNTGEKIQYVTKMIQSEIIAMLLIQTLDVVVCFPILIRSLYPKKNQSRL